MAAEDKSTITFHVDAADGRKFHEVMGNDLNLVTLERTACELALKLTGSILEASKLLGITRHALKRRIVRHNIRWIRDVRPPVAAE